ncbi:hypothetical protein M422DRAFT_242846 [Sphaerobolus stellatus SS14]|nr:hypothetical protein M422DRAFT_242846 [Sphaerobolus stellatus SS14]
MLRRLRALAHPTQQRPQPLELRLSRRQPEPTLDQTYMHARHRDPHPLQTRHSLVSSPVYRTSRPSTPPPLPQARSASSLTIPRSSSYFLLVTLPPSSATPLPLHTQFQLQTPLSSLIPSSS